MKVLLVEPAFPIKYPNLALMKLSSKYRSYGYEVQYFKGNDASFSPDIINISTTFTYYAEETIDCINFYKHNYPQAHIDVGGIFASLMPDYIKQKTNITPCIGCFEELDRIKPDYEMMKEIIKQTPYCKKWEDFSFLFTSRGCPNKCGFCAVKTLEPQTKYIENWKDLIDLNKKNIMLFDNNLTALPFEHFKSVLEYLIKIKKTIFFHNGFDVRLLTDEQMELIAKIKWYPSGLRVAFDNMSQDGHFQKKVSKLLELGTPKSAFLVFTLFNFTDTFDEAMYRCTESKKLGVRPYPCWYRELNSLDKKAMNVGKHWTKELIRLFHSYWYLAGNYKYHTFKEYRDNIEREKLEKERLKKEKEEKKLCKTI
jgi:hypothetical protein